MPRWARAHPMTSRFPLPASRFPLPASRFPLPASRFPLPASRFPLPASRFCCCCCYCCCPCGQEPALLHGAPGERREFVDQPAGAAAGMRPMFVTGQGRPVHEHPRTHANPSRTDARRARTRGGLSFGYFSLATQRKVTRAGRRTDRKLLLFASSDRATERQSDRATERNRGERRAHGGPGPTL